MNRIKLKITGDIPVAGHQPGEEFYIPADASGRPQAVYWRKRLAEKSRDGGAFVSIITDSPADKDSGQADIAQKFAPENRARSGAPERK